MLHLNDHLYSKPCIFLWIANFRGLTLGFASLPRLSRVFTIGHICITKNNEAFTRGGIYPYFLYPTHIFIFMYTIVRSCWTLSHRTKATQSNIKHSVDYNHALTPISCDAMCHYMPIPCHIYDECCMKNSTHAYHPCIMDNYIKQHKISKQSHISC